jgi:tetraprenyl-beta-curcumene synthase
MRTPTSDPLPLSRSQIAALARAATRELTWALRAVSNEERAWRARAQRIPSSALREAALSALATKRGHTDGAAMFTILPDRRHPGLLRILVAFEVIWDYLDSAHEGAPTEANGRQLHLALIDALDPDRPLSDWYRHHPDGDDGGYLRSLVEACRTEACRLTSYEQVRPYLVREAWRGQVLALNHIRDPHERDVALKRWALEEFPEETALCWYELSGAASASLVVHALLALAAEPHVTDDQVAIVRAAYWPWVSLATTMLDSWVDAPDDNSNGNHSYIAHYPDGGVAVDRICESIAESAHRVRRLEQGDLHAVIVACMVALYLTRDTARTPPARSTTSVIVDAGGSLTQVLVPILRLWRVRYRQQAL